MEPGAPPPSQPAAQICPSATTSQCPGPPQGPPPMLQCPEATCPQLPIMMTTPTSQVHQNCHQNSEAASNCHINLELTLPRVYLSMSYYCDWDAVALKNFARDFLHQSHEERECAEKLMKLQNQRGGQIFLQDIKKPDRDDWENGSHAMECASHLK